MLPGQEPTDVDMNKKKDIDPAERPAQKPGNHREWRKAVHTGKPTEGAGRGELVKDIERLCNECYPTQLPGTDKV